MCRLIMLVIGSWLLCGTIAYSDETPLVMSKNGSTEYVIVTGADPTIEERTAAQWLSETLEGVTGAKFPIREAQQSDLVKRKSNEIHIRFDPEMSAEEWQIQTVGSSLFLTGGRPRGAIYAVCEFLETHVGVLRLDPFTESVPKRPDLTLAKVDRRGRPAFPSRFVFTGWPYQNSQSQGVNGARWRIWNKEHIYAGPSNGDYPRAVPDGVHTFGHFISAKEFAADHPEYFSMDATGKRMTDDMGNKQLWIQLCVTNEDVRRITIERAKKFLRDDNAEAKNTGRGAAQFIVLSQNDNTTNLCLCPNCKAISDREGSESGALLDFVNHIARGLKDEFPDVTVLTEAYNFTLSPPNTIRAESNVLVRYCDNYGLSDMTRPLTDPRNAERLSLLRNWGKSAKQVGIWDYWRTFDSHPPGMFAPSSNVRALYRDIQLFRELGLQYVTIEVEDFMGAGLTDSPQSNDMQSFMPLRCWVGMKLLDDPSRDLNLLLDTFCRGYYGPAEKPMRELLEVIEDRQLQIEVNSSQQRRHVWLEALGDPKFFERAYQCLDVAMQLAKDDKASLVHVRRERIVIDSAFLWIEGGVRRQAGALSTLPLRTDVLKRHREDWDCYLSSVFDEEGRKKIAPLIEPGLQLSEKLQTGDTDAVRNAVAAREAELKHDGVLDEHFWHRSKALRLLPRDPLAPNDDESEFRFVWTPEALYVGIRQPLEKAAASFEVSLMTPDRKGVQADLFAQPSGAVSGYFYAYPSTGMVAVPNRKSQSKLVVSKTDKYFTGEYRIPWTDLPTDPKPGGEVLLNISIYPKLDSKAASHVSSPWLIGASPTYNPAYHSTVRLAEMDESTPASSGR